VTRSKVKAKKHFKTKIEFTGSGSRLHLKNARSDITNICFNIKYDVNNNFEIADRKKNKLASVNIKADDEVYICLCVCEGVQSSMISCPEVRRHARPHFFIRTRRHPRVQPRKLSGECGWTRPADHQITQLKLR